MKSSASHPHPSLTAVGGVFPALGDKPGVHVSPMLSKVLSALAPPASWMYDARVAVDYRTNGQDLAFSYKHSVGSLSAANQETNLC